MSDVEGKTIEYTEKLLKMWFDNPDDTVLHWIARFRAETEAHIKQLESRIAELESPEDPNRPILPDLDKMSEKTQVVALKTLDQANSRKASRRGC